MDDLVHLEPASCFSDRLSDRIGAFTSQGCHYSDMPYDIMDMIIGVTRDFFLRNSNYPYSYEHDWQEYTDGIWNVVEKNYDLFCRQSNWTSRIFINHTSITGTDDQIIIKTGFWRVNDPASGDLKANAQIGYAYNPVCVAKTMIPMAFYNTNVVLLTFMSVFYPMCILFGWFL